MATTLNEFPARRGSPGRSQFRKYLDGQIWRLAKGEDFTSKAIHVRNRFYQLGARMGVKVRVCQDGDVLIVQATPNGHVQGHGV